MKLLPEKIGVRGFEYIQEKRNKKFTIYQQWLDDTLVGYEVIKIKHQKAHQFNGIQYPERELYPQDRDWGANGWTFKTLNKAKEFFNSLSIKHLVAEILKFKDRKNEIWTETSVCCQSK